MAYDEHDLAYARWWVALWAVLSVALVALAFRLPFGWWATVVLVGFGVPEVIGVLKADAYPPLTFVLRRYVPRWVTHTLVFGVFGTVAAFWLGFANPTRMGALLALLGWLQDHFDVTYDD